MRPRVICHMMSSVDGRLLTDRWSPPVGDVSFQDFLAAYAVLGAEWKTEAWLLGRNTVREFCFPRTFDHAGLPPATDFAPHVAPRRSPRILVIPDPEGEIFYDCNTVRGDNIVALLGRQVSAAYLQHLKESGVSYLFAGKDGTDLREALRLLSSVFGIASLLLQGGGIINGAFLKAGLIDDLSLAIYPGLDGLAGIPSIFEAGGAPGDLPAAGQRLELVDMKRLNGGLVWLHYRFHPSEA